MRISSSAINHLIVKNITSLPYIGWHRASGGSLRSTVDQEDFEVDSYLEHKTKKSLKDSLEMDNDKH